MIASGTGRPPQHGPGISGMSTTARPREVWWSRLPDVAEALARGEQALRAVEARHHVVVGKSLGTLLLPVAVDLGLPGVWLTPLLQDDAVRAAVLATRAPSLLVGGTADRGAWDTGVAERARAGGLDVLEVEGADHSLELAGDTRGSLRVLGHVVDEVEAFVARLP